MQFKSTNSLVFNLLYSSTVTSILENHSSVQFSGSVVSDAWWPHGLQHTTLPCPTLAPRACSNSCPSSQWCHPTISSSVVPSSCPLSLSASGTFPGSQFFSSHGQSIGVSDSASGLPVNIQDWFPLEWTCWISLQSKRLSRVVSNTTVQKHQFLSTQLSWWSNSHVHHDNQKTRSFDWTDLCRQNNVSAF